MNTTQTTAVIDIEPQFGLQNTQVEGGFWTPLLSGVIIGIIVSKIFL